MIRQGRGTISIPGPQGPKGSSGTPGLCGAAGVDGAAGPAGETGPQGVQGLPGSTGATGPQGIQGPSGATGPQGIQGVKGDAGLKGDTGAQGIQGIQGNTGPAGTTDYTLLTNRPTLGTLAAKSSVDYSTSDIINKPTIPAAQVNSDWNAASGVTQVLNKPALGVAASLNVGTATGTVAAGDDARITGAVPSTRTVAGKALSSNVTLAASDVGLGSVTNDAQVKRTEMAAPSGVATLDASSKLVQAPTIANGAYAAAATTATTGTMTVSMGTATCFTITPTGACTFNASGGVAGQSVSLVVTTSGTTAFVLTFGTNFRTTGTLSTGTVTAKKFAISFICVDGALWVETGRTAAM